MSERPGHRVAVVGDRFMKPEFFVDALLEIEGLTGDSIRTRELEWPDTPMIQACADETVKEYLGRPEEIAAFVGDAEILVNHLAPVTANMLERLPRLKLIAVSRGGPVNVDTAACRRHDVAVVNTPGRNASAVAEFTIGAILAETRLFTQGHMALAEGRWRGELYRADLIGDELPALCVGVVGYGHIGTRVVRLLRAFGSKTLVCDPYVSLRPEDAASGVEHVDLHELLRRSDVVTLHARVTPETRGFIGAAEFEQMRDGAIFVNTARGPLVDYDALYAGLRSGKLRSAFLETFSKEPPPPDWPLLRLPNVTLTPHIAGASLTTVRLAASMIAEEVRRFLADEPLLNPV